MGQEESEYDTNRREVNISAVVPVWVADAIRRIAFVKGASRSEVVSDLLVATLTKDDDSGAED